MGKLRVLVAIVDGNLTPRGTSGTDGALITDAINKQYPHITVIGHSSSGNVFGAHYNVPPKAPFDELERVVREC